MESTDHMQEPVDAHRPRAREAGVIVGALPPGPLNAITDVEGVRVGQVTIRRGKRIRTGVTAIVPHEGNVFHERVPAAVHVANGFGKLVGSTQLQELGELETPLLLTGTLSVWKAADALVEWLLRQPGMERVRSINPLVGETNDGRLSDIRARPITPKHVFQALDSASIGPVEEGSVGAGTGSVAFGFKGGIGTSSRRLHQALGGYAVGVLVQSNYGGRLTVNGTLISASTTGEAPPGRKAAPPSNASDGSVMIVVATDAPLGSRNLQRLAMRSMAGIARTGADLSNGSGDYALAFSTARQLRRTSGQDVRLVPELANERLDPLFQAVAEATEEAVLNSLFRATTTRSYDGTLFSALPLDRWLQPQK